MMSSKGKPTPKKGGVTKTKELERKSTSKTEPSPKENVLTYPLIKTNDNDRALPRYSAVLHRTEEEGVGMDDLDALQLELEALLSAVAVRSRVLQEELQVLSNAEEKHDKKGKISPLIPGKRTKSQQEKTVKKFKETSGKLLGEASHSTLSNKFTKAKGLSTIPPNSSLSDHEPLESLKPDTPKVPPPKNDTPNKFWASVEPYCADTTPDDIRLLEDLLLEHANDSEYQKIPPLGRHYSLRWAEEDNIDEKSNKSDLSKKSDKSNEGVTTGPLSQRLISALMEENIVPADMVCRGEENRTPLELFKNFSVSNSASFERRVRKELEEQGILDTEDVSSDRADDEILQELKRCQAELKVVSAYNVQHLKRLLKQANDELVRQDLKKKLQQADAEVIETYRRVLKKKPLSKKEQDQCWKVVKDRDTILRHIDAL
ncbi:transcriptional adapter 3-B isoform X2 [Anabrus simplex]